MTFGEIDEMILEDLIYHEHLNRDILGESNRIMTGFYINVKDFPKPSQRPGERRADILF